MLMSTHVHGITLYLVDMGEWFCSKLQGWEDRFDSSAIVSHLGLVFHSKR